jgi:hypothetical protein
MRASLPMVGQLMMSPKLNHMPAAFGCLQLRCFPKLHANVALQLLNRWTLKNECLVEMVRSLLDRDRETIIFTKIAK